jgi:arabinogalactan endo-1,4-beta-galactosidase
MKLLLACLGIAVSLLSACNSTQTPEKSTDLSALYRKSTGKPETMVLACYKTTLIASGTDETRLRVCVADSTDMELMDAVLPFRISVNGDANLLNADRSSPKLVSETDSVSIWQSTLENGVKEFILSAGTTPGKFKVEVSAEGVWPASHEIHLIPSSVKLMKPQANQLIPAKTVSPKMIGADISFLPQLEAEGKKFRDGGVEKDAIGILKSHGFNYIRLRVFVNPELEKGYSPGKGYCDLEGTLAMARRIKAAGMNFLLDFHYSDYWADPQQQFKPAAWEGQEFETLKASLKEYTKATLLSLKEQGTLPQMVQVGNEINHGMVWPEGHISNPDNLAALLRAGVEACREVDPEITVMMHLALGGQQEEALFWFDNMIARGVDFDVIGLSYYPRWHGTLDDLNTTMIYLAERYQKDINVAEYSAFKQEINDMVFNLPEGRGNGTCIWEPLNTWRRLFDQQGNAVEEIGIYDKVAEKYLKVKE